MKRIARIWIGLAVAAITFGSLTAFVGTDHWSYHREHFQHYRYDHFAGCDYYKDEDVPPNDQQPQEDR